MLLVYFVGTLIFVREQRTMSYTMKDLTLTQADKEEICAHGLTVAQVEQQYQRLQTGYPSTPITAPVVPSRGLKQVSPGEEKEYRRRYSEYKGLRSKFVPASGAASRMFNRFFAYQNGQSEKKPYDGNPTLFAFYDEVMARVQAKEERPFVDEVLARYAHLPKALVPFHRYGTSLWTPIDEHLMEGIVYGRNPDGEVRLHFTVSAEHQEDIRHYYTQHSPSLAERYGVRFSIAQSIQAPATDTIAVSEKGELFRDDKGHILFRPGGHGALLHNLGSMEEELIFIKNIDNVAKQSYLVATHRYKEMLAGLLLTVRERVFALIRQLQAGGLSSEALAEIVAYCQNELSITIPATVHSNIERLIPYLLGKLNRPIRVCGMVPNEGEPGGGPFWVREVDGSESLQIVEISQLDRSDPTTETIIQQSRYFNPVDIVCSIHNYKGERFDLTKFINPDMGILVHKSYNGTPLTGLEPPGLWNGAMAGWLTLFVEVPATTFTPVKEVADLLRPAHRFDPQEQLLTL